MRIEALQQQEYNHYYQRYLDKVVTGSQLINGFQKSRETIAHFFSTLSENQLTNRYESGKWSVKEVFQHLIDSERIFMNRCFRIARYDDTALPGFDQNIYNEPSLAAGKTIHQLLTEFEATRNYSLSLLNSLSEADLNNTGIANSAPMSARAAAFIVLGHEIWHLEIIKEKYL